MRTPCMLPGMATLALLLACGSSGSAPAPPAAGPSGGQAPPGGDGVGGPADPGPATSAGPLPERFVTVERLDGDPECDALVPARIPDPVTAHVADPGGACQAAITDGTGHVAVGIGIPSPCGERLILSPGGAPAARFADCHAIAPQPDGWLLPWGTYGHGPGTVRLLSFLGDGTARAPVSFEGVSSPVIAGAWPFAADPRGGGFLVVNPFVPSLADPCVGAGHRFDAAGAPSGATATVSCNAATVGVSTIGDALAIELTTSGTRSYVRWIRPDGTAARPVTDEGDFVAIFGQYHLETAPLLDGSIAVRPVGGGWMRRYPHLAPSGEAAPAWLAARGRETYRFTRGNRGYFFAPLPGQPSADCRQSAELVAPSGRRCVRLTFREDAAGCTTGAIDQGWDGTVVQQSGKDPCSYRWWPGLLAE